MKTNIQNEAATERQLRSKAKTIGLALKKSRSRNPNVLGFGTYQLVDIRTNCLMVSSSEGWGVSLFKIGEYLAYHCDG